MDESNVDRLPDGKRQRILDAAIREFAEHGYDKASTNSIVKEAGIAKGLLFHYFGSKKGSTSARWSMRWISTSTTFSSP